MSDILMLVMSACIIGYVLRETLADLQKKKSEHDARHDRSDNTDS